MVLGVYAGDTLLVTVNGLGDTVKYRLNNADCPYAAEEKVVREAMNGIWSLPKLESPAAYRERKLAETGVDPEGAK